MQNAYAVNDMYVDLSQLSHAGLGSLDFKNEYSKKSKDVLRRMRGGR